MNLLKKAGLLPIVLWILAIFGLALTVLAYFVKPLYALIGLALTLLLLLSAFLYERFLRRLMVASYQQAASRLSATDSETLEKFPLPAVICERNGQIVWYNRLFAKRVMAGKSSFDPELTQVLRSICPDFADRAVNDSVRVGEKEFTAFASNFHRKDGDYVNCFFVEDTKQKEIIRAFYNTKPVVMLLYIDNLDDAAASLKESEKISVLDQIETLLENFMSETNGFLAKIERHRFLAVLEDQSMSQIMEGRFEILDQVRNLTPAGQLPITLSIGVGKGGNSLLENERLSRQALDMALGRGGDQAAVRTADGYSFFGGVSKSVEKRSKIKSRITASAISELIESADNVLVMGHRSADLDSLASAFCMAKAAESLGKHSNVVLRRNENLATSLLERLEQNGLEELFVTPEEAIKKVSEGTLLIVTDTHGPMTAECPPLLEACKSIVVIDHHRKSVNFIENAMIFYHEPSASSASEMVTELCQYIKQGDCIGRLEAEALLAGMMLDTHNFTTQTGVRTFESAAWLRSRGADTTEVKRLFASTAEDYRERTAIVASAGIQNGFAVAVNPEEGPIAMLVSAQAADELLSLAGVRASFVFYKNEGKVGLSGRSFGDVNVQVICEKLGGGGHQNMAGAQFAPEVTLEEAMDLLNRILSEENSAE